MAWSMEMCNDKLVIVGQCTFYFMLSKYTADGIDPDLSVLFHQFILCLINLLIVSNHFNMVKLF